MKEGKKTQQQKQVNKHSNQGSHCALAQTHMRSMCLQLWKLLLLNV